MGKLRQDGPPVTQTALAATLEAAVQAPSLHNSQPWRFQVEHDTIELRIPTEQVLPVGDPSSRAARIACGAALYNWQLACAVELGRQPEVLLLPDGRHGRTLATLRPGVARPATPRERARYAAIPRRHINRYPFRTGAEVDRAHRWALTEAARSQQCWLTILDPGTRHDLVSGLINDADDTLRADPSYQDEQRQWTHPSVTRPEGIPAPAAGIRPEPDDLPRGRDYGGRPRHRDFDTDLLAVLGGEGETEGDQICVGQALQAVLLAATESGLAVSLFSQPFEVPSIIRQLRQVLGRLGTPYLVMRIGYPSRPSPSTPRHPIKDVT